MSVEECLPRNMGDVRTYRQGRVDNGCKGGYPDRNEEGCTEGKYDLRHD